MAYAFKVTAKQNIAGKIAILEAFKTQFGIEIKGVSISTSYFTVERLK